MPDWEALFGSTTLVQAILWIVAAGLLLALLIKLWPFIKNAVAIVDALVALPVVVKRLSSLETKVDEIHHETHNNDGSSIKDSQDRTESAVRRIETSVEGVHGRLDAVESDTKEIRTQVDQLAREDESLWEALDQTNPDPEEEP